MEKNIELENLKLTTFNKENQEHMTFLKELIHDESISKRFHGLTVGLLQDKGDRFFDRAFFVTDNGNLIGYMRIGEYDANKKTVYLRAAIREQERGKGYGKQMLHEVSEYIFNNYYEVESITLKIALDNKSSLGTANACGFKWLADDFYIKYNPNLLEETVLEKK